MLSVYEDAARKAVMTELFGSIDPVGGDGCGGGHPGPWARAVASSNPRNGDHVLPTSTQPACLSAWPLHRSLVSTAVYPGTASGE
ncbi:hypothetical protein HaLaN_18052 [Haematococcus lacustris]|uniref:Uncharacterized protein n=1 Tax=Haematococcus lacustris TaxID=44745 RepID=A0A699ZR30_HAELA|nr:hypothetical protein HaLaN_18052 [Haematococcus lacustris]